MSAIAIIPARGGSKRLARKNIIDFHGKPIIAYTIEAAMKTELFDRVVVSSEDEEILDCAARFGAETDIRPQKLSTDQASIADVCCEFLERQLRAGQSYKTMTVLYATSPLRESKDIAAVLGLLKRDECHHALAVAVPNMSPHQALTIQPDGRLDPMLPNLLKTRSSDLQDMVGGNGSTYSVYTDTFLEDPGFYGAGMRGHLMSAMRSIDINDIEDIELVRLVASYLWDQE